MSITLTEEQRNVVEHFAGPLLVLAGPGSGKTRVVTQRIARLVERGIAGYSILAITFTNKAAREMKHRVETMLPNSKVFISTFHRYCAWMLRKHPQAVGLNENFTIFDTSDQLGVIRRCLEDINIDKKMFTPSRLLGAISRQKNELITPQVYAEHYRETNATHFDAVVAKLYPKYQQALLEANAVDFDDLLVFAVKMLEDNENLRLQFSQRFSFLLVDEYQDTNYVQYSLVKALGEAHQNVCVTGDPDQLIYSWRGSRLDNIMHFGRDFPNAKVYKLEENFRSTKAILRPADRLITHNRYRKPKDLYTNNEEGQPVEMQLYQDHNHEADEIARAIKNVVNQGKRKWSDYAILFRINALSRPLELALYRHGIPYQVAGGVEYWQRTEIKDMTAYLRVLLNPQDNEALLRVINKPARGIGEKSMKRLEGWAQRYKGSILEACRHVRELPGFAAKTAKAIEGFVSMLDDLSGDSAQTVSGLIKTLLQKTKLTSAWEKSDSEEDLQRKANIDEMINAASEYENSQGEEASLQGFLEDTVLISDQDNLDENQGKVSLMTLHSAKGLEFPVVYLVGVEQEILPHERALKSTEPNELEEERRLLFVGITRAKQELYLTETKVRLRQGRVTYCIPSGFRSEMMPDINLVNIPLPLDIPWNYGLQSTSSNFITPQQISKLDNGHPPSTTRQHITDKPLLTAHELENRSKKTRLSIPLTTGAQLLSQQSDKLANMQKFTLGTAVSHPRYGIGTIEKISGAGIKLMTTVRFQNDRTETFMLSKSPLELAE